MASARMAREAGGAPGLFVLFIGAFAAPGVVCALRKESGT